MELPIQEGYADNLLMTPRGDIVLVECKLWRNPEARREVVAQIIDYAHRMAFWSYQDLEAAVATATVPEGEEKVTSLFNATHGEEDGDETVFVDAVSRNLRLGRMLLLIVGDGIREGVETLTDYLQDHAGFHFTLGIVEIALHRMPNASFLMQPNVLARTVNIERGIVRVLDGRPVIEPPPMPAAPRGRGRRTTITEEQFFEQIAVIDPTLPERLQTFITSLADHGIAIEWGASSLILKWESPDGTRFTLGYIQRDTGRLQTDAVNWRPDALGRVDLAHSYLRDVAKAIACTVKETPTPNSWYVVGPDKKAPLVTIALDHAEAWLAAIDRYTAALKETLNAGDGT